MRPNLIAFATIVALALAPVALAGPNEHAVKGQDKAAGARDENATGATAASHADGAQHGKKPAFATWHATMKALLTSWLENATKVRADCHAAEKDDNATKEERLAAAHCIRDGYKAFFEHLRADREAARADAHAA